jgi:ATP-dependent Clp protease adaptor protein ClpS
MRTRASQKVPWLFAFREGLAKIKETVRLEFVGLPQFVQVMAKRSEEGTILEKKAAKVKPPPLFKVLLLNDDYTPMEFVVIVLQKFFSLGREQATRIMLKVHTEGRGVCGVYPKDVAATKVESVLEFARQYQHPLQCVMEES